MTPHTEVPEGARLVAMNDALADLVRAAGGDPGTCKDPFAYLLTTIAERDSMRKRTLALASDAEVIAEAGRRRAAMRKVKTGGRNGGRPRKLERCACGSFALNRMPKTHSCVLSVICRP